MNQCRNFSVEEKYVLLGGHTLSQDSNGAMVPIKSWIVHPSARSIGSSSQDCQKDNWDYMDTLIEWDIAIIVLESQIRFSTYIQPACLPLPSSKLEVNDEVYVYGWGATTPNKISPHRWEYSIHSKVPKVAQLLIQDQTHTCKVRYEKPELGSDIRPPEYNDASFQCVIGKEEFENNKKPSPSKGDSGGNIIND